MAKIQPVWALDVGQAALKALKLVPGETPDQVIAEAFDYVEYPKILSQPDADPDQLVREALETFLERNELKGCKVAIAVPGQAGLVKFIKLPPVEKKRIPDIVKFEARAADPVRAGGGGLGLPADRRRRGRRGRRVHDGRGRPVRHEARPDQPGDPAVQGRRDRGRHRPDGPDRAVQLHHLRPDQGTAAVGRGRETDAGEKAKVERARSSCSTSAPTTPT